MSGSYVIKQGNQVSKTATNSKQAIEWYEKAKDINLHTPLIHKLIGKTITMEYIDKTADTDVVSLCNVIDSYNSKTLNVKKWNVYIDRCNKHIKEQKLNREYIDVLDNNHIADVMNNNVSFCHGDSAIDNFITRGDHIYFIDPIYSEKDFTSWLLDVSKLAMSLNRFNEASRYEYVMSRYAEYPMKQLELSHWLRFYKYTDNKKVCQEKIEELYHVSKN